MVHLRIVSWTSLSSILLVSEQLVGGSSLSCHHHLRRLDLCADSTHLLRLTASEIAELATWLEIVLQAAKRLTHLLLVLRRLFYLFGSNLRTLTLAIPCGVRMTRLAALTVTDVDVLLVILPPVHHDCLGLRRSTGEVALLDIADGSSAELVRVRVLVLVLHVLIRDLGAMWEV